ncbi:MAG: virulence-related protein [Desulfitobacteriia bacterium]|jgi:hypothetical protein
MNRKAVLEILTEHFNVKAKYLGAPTFAYEIAAENETYTIDVEGNITTATGQEVKLKDLLQTQEVEIEVAEECENLDQARANLNTTVEPEIAEELATPVEQLTPEPTDEITVPPTEILLLMEGHNGRTLRNLVNILYSKQPLIKKAFGLQENIVEEDFCTKLNEANVETLEDFETASKDIEETGCPGIKFNFYEQTMTLKFFKDESDTDRLIAQKQLIAAVNKLAKTLKYASSKTKPTDNEKYTFRTWLLRLGMIGDEYKLARKILLQNLSGNSAFRRPAKEEA